MPSWPSTTTTTTARATSPGPNFHNFKCDLRRIEALHRENRRGLIFSNFTTGFPYPVLVLCGITHTSGEVHRHTSCWNEKVNIQVQRHRPHLHRLLKKTWFYHRIFSAVSRACRGAMINYPGLYQKPPKRIRLLNMKELKRYEWPKRCRFRSWRDYRRGYSSIKSNEGTIVLTKKITSRFTKHTSTLPKKKDYTSSVIRTPA